MASVNMATIIGNCGADPEMRSTKGGEQVANFRVATNKKWTKDGSKHEETTWHHVSAFGKIAEIIGKYVTKGSMVYIQGEIRNETWDKDDGTKGYKTSIVAQNIQLLTPKSSGPQVEPDFITDAAAQRPPGVRNYADDIGKKSDGEVPF